MPRYTDIDLLIDKVEGTDWYHVSKQGELVRGANSKDDIPLYKHSDIKDVLNNAPIADVVPKSELSIIGVQNMALENTNVDLKRRLVIAEAVASVAIGKASDMVSESKREVAREIFAEIEKILNSRYAETQHTLHGLNTDSWFAIEQHGKLVGIAQIGDDLAELKKKYTEDQK